jgi:hypothetical protein
LNSKLFDESRSIERLFLLPKGVIPLTIQYARKQFPPPPFDIEVAEANFHRKLYDGDHADIFPRARHAGKDKRYRWRRKSLKEWEQVTEVVESGVPYIVVNFCSLIAELPADLINRSLGNISADSEDQPELDFVSGVVEASKVNDGIWAAITQHQVDGMIAYRVRREPVRNKVWFEWILRDKFLPHDDDLGADIAWIEERGEDDNKKQFLRVERQRLTETGLTMQQMVFRMDGDSVGEEMDVQEYAREYNVEIPEDVELPGVTELMCGMVTNEATLRHPRGRSALRNVVELQEEINWTITRDAVIFEKHGKPKLAIPRALWNTVAETNNAHYGQRFVRNADLEVVSYDENKGAVPQYITWDAKTQQSFEHVTRLIKYMLAITKTSPQAAGLENGTGQSAIALLYLWIQSVIKAEAIRDKFDVAIKDAIRKCIILENTLGGTQYEVKAPVIEWGDMLPKAEAEQNKEERANYEAGVQSLETTVRRLHPDWSEEAIEEEIRKIQDEKAVDSLNPTYTQPPRVTL